MEGHKLKPENEHITFRVTVPEYPVHIYAAPQRLFQVFTNIIDNAVSFSPPEGAVTIGICKNATAAVVTISDEGPGIPTGNLDKIFGRFYTYRTEVSKTIRPTLSIEHTGLGLAIVKAIVEGYEGNVSVENLPGRGACFRVRLPAGL